MAKLFKILAAGGTTLVLIAVIGGVAAYGSFLPIGRAKHLFGSHFFIAILALFFINILSGFIILFRRKTPGIWSHLVRLGALLVLFGAALGRFYGKRGYAQLYEEQQTGEFRGTAGGSIEPGFVLRLDRFSVERYPEGNLEIGISAGSNGELRIYPVEIGRWTGPDELRVLPVRYVPDFKVSSEGTAISKSAAPNNPALEIEVKADGETERGWLFARFPCFPPLGLSHTLRAGRIIFFDRRSENIKSYRSEVTVFAGTEKPVSGVIEVNRPLRFGGYRIYQTKYDPVGWQWSGFELVRDPGLPFVYCGFILLALGFTIWVGQVPRQI